MVKSTLVHTSKGQLHQAKVYTSVFFPQCALGKLLIVGLNQLLCLEPLVFLPEWKPTLPGMLERRRGRREEECEAGEREVQ